MTEENKTTKPVELPFYVKIGGILIGTTLGLLAVYFGFKCFSFFKAYFFSTVGQLPPINESLPPVLHDINPVIWEEANRITRASR